MSSRSISFVASARALLHMSESDGLCVCCFMVMDTVVDPVCTCEQYCYKHSRTGVWDTVSSCLVDVFGNRVAVSYGRCISSF